jgi:PHD-finger
MSFSPATFEAVGGIPGVAPGSQKKPLARGAEETTTEEEREQQEHREFGDSLPLCGSCGSSEDQSGSSGVMLLCGLCDGLFHARCVGVPEEAVRSVEGFVCGACEKQTQVQQQRQEKHERARQGMTSRPGSSVSSYPHPSNEDEESSGSKRSPKWSDKGRARAQKRARLESDSNFLALQTGLATRGRTESTSTADIGVIGTNGFTTAKELGDAFSVPDLKEVRSNSCRVCLILLGCG